MVIYVKGQLLEEVLDFPQVAEASEWSSWTDRIEGQDLRIDAMCDNDQLVKLRRALEIAKANKNQLFVSNIERDIAALKAGKESPIIKEYLTPEERAKLD